MYIQFQLLKKIQVSESLPYAIVITFSSRTMSKVHLTYPGVMWYYPQNNNKYTNV